MTTERSRPSKEGARMMAIIEGAVPDLVAARDLTMSPRGIIASIIKAMPTMRGPPHTNLAALRGAYQESIAHEPSLRLAS